MRHDDYENRARYDHNRIFLLQQMVAVYRQCYAEYKTCTLDDRDEFLRVLRETKETIRECLSVWEPELPATVH